MTDPPVLLVTYSTKPRGGVVHTLALAEALHAAARPYTSWRSATRRPGFFRPVARAGDDRAGTVRRGHAGGEGRRQHRPACRRARRRCDAPLLHTQDCIAARAAARVRDAGAAVTVRAHGAPRGRLLQPGPHGLPARSHPRAGRGAGGQRGVAAHRSRTTTASAPGSCPTASTSPRFAAPDRVRAATLRAAGRAPPTDR